MPASDHSRGLLLNGLDGSNPLGFLAAVGTLRVLGDAFGNLARLGWRSTRGNWRPFLAGCGGDKDEICSKLLDLLKHASMTVFDIGRESKNNKEYNKFPFPAGRLVQEFTALQVNASPSERRDVDFLASFGTELYPDAKTDEFQETRFRMVRSGDSNRQGMLFYAKAIRESLDRHHVERALFRAWDYQDEGYSLRWDPIEDQPYALRWRDPSKSNPTDGPGTMLAANSLAIEALRYFPTFAMGKQAHTAGFHRNTWQGLRFVWPVWTPLVDMETLRSLVALRELHENPPRRSALLAMGIAEIYSARQIRPNQYYSNFAPARPLV